MSIYTFRALAKESLGDRYRRAVTPSLDGLPNWRVVAWFPILLALGATALIVLNISGTSSGAWWAVFGEGVDPQALVGGARPIRSDEWLVHQGWVISQYRQGFPVINGTFPGGAQLTVAMELPSWEWAALFRPHAWGYLLFGLGVGIAWQWWVPAFFLVASCYLFIVTLMPRRAMTAAVIACAVFFTPLFQWWYGPNTLMPAAWAFLAMAATIWMLRTKMLWHRVVWGALVGWMGVTIAMSLYVPYVLSAFIVFLFFFIGMVLQEQPWKKGRGASTLGRLSPFIIAGVAAVTLFGLWLLSKAEAIGAISSTVYPGQRSELTGQLLVQDPYLTMLGGGVWGQTMRTVGGPTILGPNPSESATVLLLALFLLPALLWLVWRTWRGERRLDWVLIAVAACSLLLVAYLLIPGWEWLARLLLLDRIPVTRVRMAFAILGPLIFALIAHRVDQERERHTTPLAVFSGLIVLLANGYILLRIVTRDPQLLEVSFLWPIALLGLLAAVILVFYKRFIATAAVMLLLASLCIGAAVNPLYRGSFDLAETEIGRAVVETNTRTAGVWVGVGSHAVMGVMMETGVEAYNGVQTYPPQEMWEAIDPEGGDEAVWNRLAHVRWVFGPGEPKLSNPSADVILATFDACSTFAQEHVDYVLADESTISPACLEREIDITQGHSRMQIYRVVPAGT